MSRHRRATRVWIDQALPRLGLAHWRVTLSRAPADDDAHAQIIPQTQSYDAELCLDSGFAKLSPERQRELLTHELLHIAFAHVDAVVERLEPVIGTAAWAIFEPAYTDAAERAIDEIARVIAPSLPRIELTGGEG
jgi:hypothetical protein